MPRETKSSAGVTIKPPEGDASKKPRQRSIETHILSPKNRQYSALASKTKNEIVSAKPIIPLRAMHQRNRGMTVVVSYLRNKGMVNETRWS